MITQRTNKRNSVWLGLSLALAAVTLLALGILLTSDSLAAPLAESLIRPLNTNVSGVITQSTTWDVGGSPYVLTGDVTVNPGVTLTIKPGVTVQGANNVELLVEGHLAALGTTAAPITFTSSADTGPAEWAGLAFDGGTGHLRHATVRYAGDRNSVTDALYGAHHRSNLAVRNGTLRLENVTVRDLATDSYDYGLVVEDSHLVISDTLFTGIGGGTHADSDVPMRLSGPDTVLEMSGCTFTGNTNDRVLLDPGAMMGHDTTLAAQPVLDGYEFREDFTVPPTVTLTLEPGVTVQGANNVELLVEGHLAALGTTAAPITFTSSADTGPAEWAGLAFDGGTGHLRHATVRYAGDRNSVTDALLGAYHRSNLAVRNGTLRLENVTVRDLATDNYDYGLVIDDSHVVVSDTLFTGIGGGTHADSDVPMRLSGPDTVLEMSGCTFTGNTSDRVRLETGAMMGHDATLTAQPVLEGYELSADFIVPPTVTLTLRPGVTIMANSALHKNTVIQGHLEALGTAGQPITFTSVADSGSGQWAGLVFDGGTGNLRYATVRYAGDRNHVTDEDFGHWGRSAIAIRDVLTGEVHLENVTIRDIATNDIDMGIYVGNSKLVVENSYFTGIGNGDYYNLPDTPLCIAGGNTVATLTNNTFTANDSNGIVLQPGAMMNHDITLTPQNNLDGYIFPADFTIPPTVTLTVDPGVTVIGGKTGYGAELRVEGQLNAVGSYNQPITFTSFETEGSYRWTGIVVDGGTVDIRHTVLEYSDHVALSFEAGTQPLNLSDDIVRHSSNGIYLAPGVQAVLTNSVIVDISSIGLEMDENSHADLWHTTFARGGESGTNAAGLTVGSGGTATLVNSIFSNLETGVRVKSAGAVTMTNTLWDTNDADTVGTVNETGHFEGLALFEDDGYHLTRYSAAINRGVDAGIFDDIDGDSRPLPVGTLHDLGADEIAESLDELVAEMDAYSPLWISAVDEGSGLPYSRLRQRYLIGLYYGSSESNPPNIDLSINDTLATALIYETEQHSPLMNFTQQGQLLTWQAVSPLVLEDTAQVLLSAIAENPTPGETLTNTAHVEAGAAQFDLFHAYKVPLFPPLITTPGNGEICTSAELGGTQIIGMAQGNAIIRLYENGTEVLTTTAEASGVFSLTYTSARVGIDAETTLTAVTSTPSDPTHCSDPSNAVILRPVQSFWCPQRSYWTVPPPSPYQGTYKFIDPDTGEYATEDWVIVGPHHFPESTISLYLPNPGGQPTAPYITVDGGAPIHPTPPTPTLPPWIYNFPVPMRPHDIIFWNNLDPLGNSDGGRLIDPDGYIFDVNQGFDPDNPTLNTVEGVTVTCMVSMTAWGGWVPWPAHLYENQINPQVTGEEGYFAFFTPPGHYYLQVEEFDGYQAWRSPVVEVISEVVHVNVPYTPWTIEGVSQVILTADGPEPAVITVPAGSTVEWVAQVNGLIPPEERMALIDNPALRTLSDLDPISFTDGWDGGKMAPGKIFRRQFATPGTYDYTDGAGHSGQVVVTPYRIYLPLVLRNYH